MTSLRNGNIELYGPLETVDSIIESVKENMEWTVVQGLTYQLLIPLMKKEKKVELEVNADTIQKSQEPVQSMFDCLTVTLLSELLDFIKMDPRILDYSIKNADLVITEKTKNVLSINLHIKD